MAIPWAVLAALGGSLLGRLTDSGNDENNGVNPGTQAAMTQLLNQQVRRTGRTDPLHQMLVQMAERMLPIYARTGINSWSSGEAGNQANSSPYGRAVRRDGLDGPGTDWTTPGGTRTPNAR